MDRLQCMQCAWCQGALGAWCQQRARYTQLSLTEQEQTDLYWAACILLGTSAPSSQSECEASSEDNELDHLAGLVAEHSQANEKLRLEEELELQFEETQRQRHEEYEWFIFWRGYHRGAEQTRWDLQREAGHLASATTATRPTRAPRFRTSGPAGGY